jgi:hypothetical protein
MYAFLRRFSAPSKVRGNIVYETAFALRPAEASISLTAEQNRWTDEGLKEYQKKGKVLVCPHNKRPDRHAGVLEIPDSCFDGTVIPKPNLDEDKEDVNFGKQHHAVKGMESQEMRDELASRASKALSSGFRCLEIMNAE